MKSFISIVCLLLILLITNCTPKVVEPISEDAVALETEFYKKLAEDMCVCTEGLINVLKEQRELSTEEKIEKKVEFDKRIKTEAEKSESCIARLNEENSAGMREIKQDLSEAALKNYCPDFYYMTKIGRIR